MEDYKEKYESALERAMNFIENGDETEKTVAESIFAGLIESEDDKIRKTLVDYFKERDAYRDEDETFYGISFGNIISWLEKQKPLKTPQWMIDFLNDHRKHFGTPMEHDERKDVDGQLLAIVKWLEGNPNIEQKHVEWSEEDERILNSIITYFELNYYAHKTDFDDTEFKMWGEYYNWIKSLKERCVPQQKQECSEEDDSKTLRYDEYF